MLNFLIFLYLWHLQFQLSMNFFFYNLRPMSWNIGCHNYTGNAVLVHPRKVGYAKFEDHCKRTAINYIQ